MSDAWTILGWAAIATIAIGLAILVALIAATVIDAIRDHRTPDGTTVLARYLVSNMPEPGEEVWLRVSCCSADTCTGKHVTIQPLPTLREA